MAEELSIISSNLLTNVSESEVNELINQMVEKNIEKANVKRVKKGQKPLKAKAVMNVRTIEEERELEEKKEAELKERVTKQVEKSTEYYSTTQKKKGKLASKAGMVQQYNEKSEKKNRK